jgi:hypothetical protein
MKKTVFATIMVLIFICSAISINTSANKIENDAEEKNYTNIPTGSPNLHLKVSGATSDDGSAAFLGISIIGRWSDYTVLKVRPKINCWNDKLSGGSTNMWDSVTYYWRLKDDGFDFVRGNSAELRYDSDGDGDFDERLDKIYFIIIRVGSVVIPITTPVPI